MGAPNRISVIIPAYNGEAFIQEAIESVRRQTFSVSEIIVIDDGSIDRTAEIGGRLGATVIRQPNRGVCAARNAGIRAAQNEWIAFIDQDDLWLPDKIESQLKAVSTYPSVGVVSCHLSWFEDRGVNEPSVPIEGVDDHQEAETDDREIAHFQRVEEFPLSRMLDYMSSVLVRRELIMSVGMFDERLQQNEDLECFLRVIAVSPLAVVCRKLVKRRLHESNVSLNDQRGAADSYRQVLDLMLKDPGKYPPGAARAYNRSFSKGLIMTGRTLLDEGKTRDARALFCQSMARHYSIRAMILWCASFLRTVGFSRAIAIKRRLF